MIVKADGYIITNNHVIDGATDVRVTLLDKREFKARSGRRGFENRYRGVENRREGFAGAAVGAIRIKYGSAMWCWPWVSRSGWARA